MCAAGAPLARSVLILIACPAQSVPVSGATTGKLRVCVILHVVWLQPEPGRALAGRSRVLGIIPTRPAYTFTSTAGRFGLLGIRKRG